MQKRFWKKESEYHWRCAPWTICLAFVDGCSLYCLSKDGIDSQIFFTDEFDIAKQKARELENGKD